MEVFKRIPELLANGEDLVLAVIVSRSGSAPRAAGARMLVRKDGAIVGTIGGGILEAKVQSLAKTVFAEKVPVLRKFVLTPEDAGRLGMICGGEVEVLVHLVTPGPANVQFYREVLTAVGSGKPRWLITEITAMDGGDREAPLQYLAGKGIILAGPAEGGDLKTLPAIAGAKQPEVVEHEGKRFLIESLSGLGTVYIFGAGHVSQKLSLLTGPVGFRTVVLDDRREFANRERFDTADEIIVPDSFGRAFEGLKVNEDSYLVLVTRGHAHDKTVLRQALKTRAGYIGMIGSKKKRDAVYQELLLEGFSPAALERVHSPIGIEIGAETPGEIAVSIVAELIKVRAARNQPGGRE